MIDIDRPAQDIWGEDDCQAWHGLLGNYPLMITAQENERLGTLDIWYRVEFPALLKRRAEPYIMLSELQSVAAWKMTRGVWRERNRQLIGGNPPEAVIETSRKAFSETPDPRKPIATLSTLAGVGPATASAVMAAYAPQTYPFFDELVAAQIPTLGAVAFTLKYYLAYAEALRERADQLNATCTPSAWTAQDVAQALWAASGGKARQ